MSAMFRFLAASEFPPRGSLRHLSRHPENLV